MVDLPETSDAREHWEAYLEPGERLLWQGRPESGVFATPASVFLSIFGIPFLGAGLFVITQGIVYVTRVVSGIQNGLIGTVMVAFGIPFLTVGVALVFGPWFGGMIAHRRVRYALSNRRAYITKAYWNKSIACHALDANSPIELVRGRADSVFFQAIQSVDSDGDKTTTRIGFENIADGNRVFTLMRDVQRGEA